MDTFFFLEGLNFLKIFFDLQCLYVFFSSTFFREHTRTIDMQSQWYFINLVNTNQTSKQPTSISPK